MTTTQQIEASNDLRFSTSKTIGREHITVKIRLNDECKNGHQDFAITADIYEAGKPKIDKYFIAGGYCHDEILKAFPQFKIFVNLHLCDYEGVPTYAVENGFYHLRNGFNSTKPEDNEFKAKFCNYYRLTHEQFDTLNTSRNQLQYALHLDKLGILAQWKVEALTAIVTLENLTGKHFKNDSVKSQYHAPTPKQLQEEKHKEDSGYYTPEAEEQRQEDKKQVELNKLIVERDKEILKANTEFEVKKQVLEIGGKTALDNCIFYTHSNTLAFNWRGYDRISDTLIAKIKDAINLPEGVILENKNK